MSLDTPASCPHDIGPGTTVCLRCRRDARATARARRYRLLARLGLAGLVLSGFAAVGTAGANALQARRSADAAARPIAEASTPAKSTARRRGAKSDRPSPTAEPDTQPAPPPMWPVFAAGRAALRDDLFAMRDGNTVTVHFDTPGKRTRRPEKFEAVVRATLGQVYGPAADSLLATIPDGSLARGGDLLTELPTRGLRWTLASGWRLEVWPETRPGEDGPLVIAYRTTVVR